MKLPEYIVAHTDRGECKCGKCVDVGNIPDPQGHTADVGFFVMVAKDAPSVEEFRKLTLAHRGSFTECNPLDGQEHNYIELGAWLGDQQLALRYMGLGTLLDVFDLLTPKTVLRLDNRDELAQAALANGLCSIKAKP